MRNLLQTLPFNRKQLVSDDEMVARGTVVYSPRFGLAIVSQVSSKTWALMSLYGNRIYGAVDNVKTTKFLDDEDTWGIKFSEIVSHRDTDYEFAVLAWFHVEFEKQLHDNR